jgi:hypothetical protein
MRVLLAVAASTFTAFAAATSASATTIVVFTNPETMQSKAVVLAQDGPDRVFMCMLPPGEAGCHQVKIKRKS